jgi:hypothetical protein
MPAERKKPDPNTTKQRSPALEYSCKYRRITKSSFLAITGGRLDFFFIGFSSFKVRDNIPDVFLQFKSVLQGLFTLISNQIIYFFAAVSNSGSIPFGLGYIGFAGKLVKRPV